MQQLSERQSFDCHVLAGKREAQGEPQPPEDKNSCTSGSQSQYQWEPATKGSLGLDLATAVETTLIDTKPVAIETEVVGPIVVNGKAVGGLLIGRSSATMGGLTVLPGVVDADCAGVIKIMTKTDHPPINIPKGSKIAQIILLPQLIQGPDRVRGDQGFGSTGGMVLFSMSMGQRPTKPVTLASGGVSVSIRALFDTGADITIVSVEKWPKSWAVIQEAGTVRGVGGSASVQKSSVPVSVSFEGKHAFVRPTIMTLPSGLEALVGRDVMVQWGAVLTTEKDF